MAYKKLVGEEHDKAVNDIFNIRNIVKIAELDFDQKILSKSQFKKIKADTFNLENRYLAQNGYHILFGKIHRWEISGDELQEKPAALKILEAGL